MRKWKTSLPLVLLALLVCLSNERLVFAASEGSVHTKSVRTYMNFAKEVDPAHILTPGIAALAQECCRLISVTQPLWAFLTLYRYL